MRAATSGRHGTRRGFRDPRPKDVVAGARERRWSTAITNGVVRDSVRRPREATERSRRPPLGTAGVVSNAESGASLSAVEIVRPGLPKPTTVWSCVVRARSGRAGVEWLRAVPQPLS